MGKRAEHQTNENGIERGREEKDERMRATGPTLGNELKLKVAGKGAKTTDKCPSTHLPVQ